MAQSSRQNKGNSVITDVSCLTVHVSDRLTNSHRKASSPRQVTHVTYPVASQKQLVDPRIIRKSDPDSQIPVPTFTMVARRKQYTRRPTITPTPTCTANLYRHIKRRVGRSLKRTHCQRGLVTPYKLSGTESTFSSFERIPRPLFRQDSTCSH